ncbi:hypothetical protein Dda_8170 [Drechslerella dactyloides]|uniref:Uncharacterized protein n=1 Tax=Drechslerella dactyloides TaxID=74499 RepID=A0AAD6IUY7_DREDA|nr:hypothetical protein Dda_8170 [Drechslerella dactyloides]
MQFTVFTTLLLAAAALASPAPAPQGFQVVIKYVDAPNCDVACGANVTAAAAIFTTTSTSTSSTSTSSICTSSTSTEEEEITITSTNTKFVIVTVQTDEASTETLGSETVTSLPSDLSYETAAPEPTY